LSIEAWTGNISEKWMRAEMFLALARAFDRARFDYILLEDSVYVGQFLRKAGKNTLREAIIPCGRSGMSVDLIASPASVAAKMANIMQEIGGDGYLIALNNVSRRSVAGITDGLVPALQAAQAGAHRLRA
jgi:hypothetical protein